MLRTLQVVGITLLLAMSGVTPAPAQLPFWDPFPGKPDPWASGTIDNGAFEARYGIRVEEHAAPGPRAFPGFVVEMLHANYVALREACLSGELRLARADCEPSFREMHDLAATERRPALQKRNCSPGRPCPPPRPSGGFYCRWWFATTQVGGTPATRVAIIDRSLPVGDQVIADPFYGCPLYVANRAADVLPPVPPPPPPVTPPPAPIPTPAPAAPLPADRRAEDLALVIRILRTVFDCTPLSRLLTPSAHDVIYRPGLPSTGRIDIKVIPDDSATPGASS